MSEYCKYCETEIIEDFNEFACCDEEKIDRLEKENAELKLQLEIAHKFYEKLLYEIPEGLAEWKGLSLKDMTDYYLKKLEQLKEQGDE